MTVLCLPLAAQASDSQGGKPMQAKFAAHGSMTHLFSRGRESVLIQQHSTGA